MDKLNGILSPGAGHGRQPMGHAKNRPGRKRRREPKKEKSERAAQGIIRYSHTWGFRSYDDADKQTGKLEVLAGTGKKLQTKGDFVLVKLQSGVEMWLPDSAIVE